MEADCNTANINDFLSFGFKSRCDFAAQNCAEATPTIKLFSFYYCELEEEHFLFIPLSIFAIIIMFFTISYIAENYLEPTMSKIANMFYFSESLAGVTLVALANGAPDVISSFAAAAKPQDGLLVTVGSLFGAGMFTICVVTCACILLTPGKEVKTEKSALVRDCSFYLAGAIYLFVCGIIGQVSWPMATGILLIYTCFLGFVIHYEIRFRRDQRVAKEVEADLMKSRVSNAVLKHECQMAIQNHYIETKMPEANGETEVVVFHMEESQTSTKPHQLNKSLTKSILTPILTNSSVTKALFSYNKFKLKMKAEKTELTDRHILFSILSTMYFPLRLMQKLTIPATIDEKWRKSWATLYPFTVSAFLILYFGYIKDVFTSPVGISVWVILCSILSGITWKLTHNNKFPRGIVGYLIIALSLISAVLWINFVAGCIVDFVQIISTLLKLPLNYVSLTLLAWGNSLPDLFVDLALARKGYVQAALSGIFAGQYFNLSVGFGAALLRQIISSGPVTFKLLELKTENIVSMLLIVFLIFGILSTIVYGHISKYVLGKKFAIYLLMLYGTFFIAVTYFSCIAEKIGD